MPISVITIIKEENAKNGAVMDQARFDHRKKAIHYYMPIYGKERMVSWPLAWYERETSSTTVSSTRPC
jgi:hypothetical protein